MQLRSFLAAVIALVAIPAFATPQPHDATGLWMNGAESGWGLSVYHQGDTLFASLFVYGVDGQPTWYSASGLTGGPTVYSGSLIEATGPYLGASSFDPNSVTRRVVGAMTLTLGDKDATLDYTVNGTHVVKQVTRFSIRPLNLGGAYNGVELQPASVSGTEKAVLDQHITLDDNGSTVTMFTDSDRTSGCTFNGTTRAQDGETLAVSGSYTCGSGASGSTGPWSMTVDPTPHGFTGSFGGNGLAQGRIAAANRNAPNLQGTGWINDLWFTPAESGWGVNLVEQGDTAFATLFVYDAQNRPHWYTASQLTASTSGGRPAWSGALEESTGPYFGAPTFDPTAVKRILVGSMFFQVAEDGSGMLSYSVNGVQVDKRVSRFAFRKNDLSGSYQGDVVMRTDDPRGLSFDDASFTIDDQGDRVSMSIVIATGPTCTFTGQGVQFGSQRAVNGSYSCQGAQGTFSLNDLMVTADGLTGSYSGPAGHIGGTITNGTISGARR